MKIKAVLFDMDGLVLDSQRLGSEAWKETVASCGYLMTDEINLRLIGRNKKDIYEILRLAFGFDFPAEEIWEKSYRNFFHKADSSGIPLKRNCPVRS
jgi:beta-phosphoglucomutase-like phosphatase (HAD superfamily)